MEKLKIEEALALECKDKISHVEVNDILKESGISSQEYNGYILDLLGAQKIEKPPILHTESLIDENMRRNILNSKGKRIPGNEISNQIHHNLETFYNIEHCPSFLYHGALLSPEDYNFFLEIYSDFYSLEYFPDQEITAYFDNFIRLYTTDILERCDSDMTVEKLKKIFEK